MSAAKIEVLTYELRCEKCAKLWINSSLIIRHVNRELLKRLFLLWLLAMGDHSPRKPAEDSNARLLRGHTVKPTKKIIGMKHTNTTSEKLERPKLLH